MAGSTNTVIARVGLDDRGFQEGVSKIQRGLKVVQSEFAAASSKLGDFGKSTEGLKLKADTLNKQMELQKSKVEALNKSYQESVEKKGEDAKATENLKIKYNYAVAELNKLEQELKKTTEELNTKSSAWYKLSESMEKAGQKLKSVGDKMTSVGKSLSTAVTLPLVGIGTAAVNAGMNFEEGMSRVKAISGATGDDFEKLNKQALKLGADTAFSAKEAAEGMENLASAGFSVDEIMTAMPGMLDLAASSGAGIATSSDIAASALRGFGLEASQAGHVSDVLARAAADTNAGITDMGDALKYVAPNAKAAGLNIEEISAAIGIMANVGIKGSQAGTTLRSALISLADPSSEAEKAMKAIGFSAFDSQGKMLPLKDVIANLQNGMKGLTEQQKQAALSTIFGKEAMSGMLSIVQAGPEELERLTKSFKNSDGAAKEMAGTMQDNLKGSVEQMKGSLETAGIMISQALAPHIKKIADLIGSLANKFTNLSPATQKTIIVIAGIVAAIGPLLIIIGQVISAIGAISGVIASVSGAIATAGGASAALGAAFTALTGPVGIAIAVIAGLIAVGVLLYKNWDTIKSTVSAIWEGMKSAIEGSVTAIKTVIVSTWESIKAIVIPIVEGIANVIKTIWEGVKTGFAFLWEVIKAIFISAWTIISSIVQTYINIITSVISVAWQLIQVVTTTVWNAISGVISTVWNGIVSFLNPIIQGIGNSITTAWNNIKAVTTTVFNSISSTISAVWNSIVSFIIPIINSIVSTLTTAWNTIRSVTTTVWNAIQSALNAVWSGIKSTTISVWNSISSFFSTMWSGVSSLFTNTVKGIQNTVSNVWSSILSVTTSIWNNIKSAIMTPINAAVNFVKEQLDKIKGFFDRLDIKFPHIKLPHFNIKGEFSLSPPSVPHLGVDWYAKGGIFNRPSIIGVGEAGTEAVLPIDRLDELMARAIEKAKGSNSGGGLALHIENFINNTEKDIEQLAYELEFYRQRVSMGRGGA
ncbi:phage tail tape measure protein [uncultured Clostridium sp.]|uniref:phage tail tape measure protein n=1 Tax=uncultured Clostridium sp. TaxID=59620 RepID=UPI0027DDBFE6|nr:phage tail tape measure protein [uncultured Clostridium sp.]